jgi:hypothetical protein
LFKRLNILLKAIRVLLLNVEDPCSWDDLLTYNGIKYVMFDEAARARGLFDNDEIWTRTVEEAFASTKNLRQRIRWLAIFLATAGLPNPTKILDYVLGLKSDWLINSRVAKESMDKKRQYVLTAMEWFLRADGLRPDENPYEDCHKTACEQIGLPRPENFKMSAACRRDVSIISLI